MYKFTAELIRLVKMHPILYDFTLNDYRNTKMKNQIWENIGRSLEVSGNTAKKRWKNVRDNYAKYVRHKDASIKYQDRTFERYKSWPWTVHMSFLKPYLQFVRDNRSNVEDETTVNTYSNNMEDNTILWISEDNTKPEGIQIKIENDDLEEISDKECDPIALSDTKKRKHQIDTSSTSSRIDEKEYDDIDLICLGYAKTIKKFSAKRQALVKYKIARIIMEEELLQEAENGTN